MSKLKALLIISRPTTLLTGILATWAGHMFAPEKAWNMLLFGIICVVGTQASANLFNNYLDYDIDNVNKPARAKAIDTLGKRPTLVLVTLTQAIAFLAALLTRRWEIMVITFAAAWILGAYNMFLRKHWTYNNLAVAIVAAGAPIVGGLVAGFFAWFPALMVFSTIFAREIIKDLEDIEGDARQGLKNIALMHSEHTALNIINCALAISAILVLTLAAQGTTIFLSLNVFACILIGMLIIYLNISREERRFHHVSNGMKATFFLWFISLLWL